MNEDPETLLARSAAATCAHLRVELQDVARLLDAAGVKEPARRISLVVEPLRDVERAANDALVRIVAEASEGLSSVLHDLQLLAPSAGASAATERVARAMATLHPLRRALEEAPRPEPEALLLARPKKKRAVLEVVPEQPEPAPLVERRRDRERVRLEVDIGMHSETNFFAGFGDDVSEGGIFVATYHPLAIGTELTLSFVLPSGAQVTMRGRVAWLRAPTGFDSDVHPGMGVAFTELDEAARVAIRDYMRRREPLFYET